MSKKPGYSWRFNAPSNREKSAFKDVEGDGKSFFDELVVDDWLHIEHMRDNYWWIRIGDSLSINIVVDEKTGETDIKISDANKGNQVVNMLDSEILLDVLRKFYSVNKG